MKHELTPPSTPEVTDPVCGMTFAPEDAAGRAEFNGHTYYFCAPVCQERFEANPNEFVRSGNPAGSEAAAHRDPVCGMEVTPEEAAGSLEHDGRTYFFCSRQCLSKFRSAPQDFLDPSAAPGSTAPVAANVEYTCPMDPEVRQIGPGACPKCGMALEPATYAPPAARTEYTCPMHPEIVRAEPGACPLRDGFGTPARDRRRGESRTGANEAPVLD
jgi:Cu+-exporting ATPase